MSSTADTRLIWIDLEMTGLDTDNDQIIEVATIVTDDNLNILAEGPVLAIHQPDRVLNAMDEWNTRQHGQSGLIERVRRSKLTAQDAEQQTLEFLKKMGQSKKLTNVWQFNLPRPPFFTSFNARNGTIFPLP